MYMTKPTIKKLQCQAHLLVGCFGYDSPLTHDVVIYIRVGEIKEKLQTKD